MGERRGAQLGDRLLATLRRASRPRTTRELCDAYGITPNRIINALRQLERKGLAEQVERAHAYSSWRATGAAQ